MQSVQFVWRHFWANKLWFVHRKRTQNVFKQNTQLTIFCKFFESSFNICRSTMCREMLKSLQDIYTEQFPTQPTPIAQASILLQGVQSREYQPLMSRKMCGKFAKCSKFHNHLYATNRSRARVNVRFTFRFPSRNPWEPNRALRQEAAHPG